MAARLGRPRTALCGATRGVPKTGLAARVVGGNADVLGGVLLAHWYHGAFWLHCGAFECVLFCHHRPGQWHTAGAFCVVAALGRALGTPWGVRLLLPACTYVALDYLFPRVFPWYLGFLQFQELPFIQIADLAGVHGVTFCLVVCNTVVAALHPASGAARARHASRHGARVCQSSLAAVRLWPLAHAAS